MKKTCILYGNCQINPIIEYLMSSKSFNSIYKIVKVPPVHLLKQEGGLKKSQLNSLSNCDLFMYQPVSEMFGSNLSTNYILSLLPTKCMTLSFPVSFFLGYYPQTIHIDTDPYADKNIISLLNEGKSKEQIVSILSDDNFYSYHEVMTTLEATLAELKRRDKALDITLDNYIENNFRDLKLFYTINHPSYHVTQHLAMKILDKLGLPKEEICKITIPDRYFMERMQPIYPSVIKHLYLNFGKFRYLYFNLDYKPLTFSEYIAKHIDIHRANMNLK